MQKTKPKKKPHWPMSIAPPRSDIEIASMESKLRIKDAYFKSTKGKR